MATIVVQHEIRDPEKFFSLTSEVVGKAPSGVRALQFCPNQDHSRATCLWEADSLEALRAHLDPYSSGVAENTYYEVDEENAFGLPEQAPATA